ncbi:hypothetical protein AMAG_06279 [Allomyces macrogynus ATCC 38327]|uniref:t-SNARE coiled-coil homology domain-containing protein n=1 Tax=Allomyces macrogynus (strain ATCC 38327) TaxID=578462 RepID=A0A0L0SG40_ALLM3|nr:hypothetical protein AMAG_06279 [Allomyces macrogynus ATCC 38327]|eukprot:KNE61456.1 hypothetical protein AMAG_06279 [Allomyces macrogynus ATCC 38327]
MPPSSIKDRTDEFLSAVHAFDPKSNGVSPSSASTLSLSSSALSAHARRRSDVRLHDTAAAPLLAGRTDGGAHSPPPPKSEFSVMARRIAVGIQQTATKLEKLGKLAKRRTLFDDRPVEIAELTDVIKKDMTSLSEQIRLLQAAAANQQARNRPGRQEEEHSRNVVDILKTNFAKTGQGFAQVLDLRKENMKAQRERRDQFSSGPSALMLAGPQATSPLYNLDRPAPGTLGAPPTAASEFTMIDMSMTAAQQQQFAVMDQHQAYLEQRHTAIESIEQTMAELGQIFQQLGQLVAQQREQVLRIDDNVQDIETNMDMAKRELVKYWASVSSNRMLMVKIFAVVLLFFLVFVAFL